MAAGLVISDNWPNLLEPIVREAFLLSADRYPSVIPQLYDTLPSQAAWEKFQGIGAVGVDAWDQFRKTKQAARVSFDQGYLTTFTHETYLVELPIERELVEDAQYPQITDAVSALADSFSEKKETDASSLFVNAFTDAYAGADGVGLCSTLHPNGPNKTGSTQSNEGTYSLTADNVSTVRIAMMGFKDDAGGRLAINPDLLLVPPELEDAALKIVNSTNQPGSANNDINPQQGRMRVVRWNYLTDTNAWFMIDSNRMKRALKWFDRVPINITLAPKSSSAWAIYEARARYSYGWRDWRWLHGSNPS
jgi:hypothetical protein